MVMVDVDGCRQLSVIMIQSADNLLLDSA